MSFSSYSGLKDALVGFSKRKDATTARLDDFIDLAEAEMFANPVENLALEGMDTRATAPTSTSERFVALPDGFLSMRRLKLNLSNGDRRLVYVAPNKLDVIPTAGNPVQFTVTSQIGFDRVPSSVVTVEMQYFKKPDPLSDSNTSNIVLSEFPGIYLNGALWALWKFFREEELSQFYYGEFINCIQGANAQESEGRYGPNPEISLENACLYP